MDNIGGKVEIPWSKWMTPDGQVGGYQTVYTGITFTTVNGAGHMVPQDKPISASYLFNSFL